mgnify:CR=1 FL=1
MEFYMPKQVLESYIVEIDVVNLPKFMHLHLDNDVRTTVKLPATLSSSYSLIKKKLWNKRLCKDIVLTNEGIGGDEKEAYRLEEGDYRIKKFFIAERIFNTHIIFKGVYSLITELELKHDFVDIPTHKVKSRSMDRDLAQLRKYLSTINFYSYDESIRFNIWLPEQVKGFACSYHIPFSTIYEFCFTHFVLRDSNAPELVSLSESYVHDLEADYKYFKKKLSDAIDNYQSMKELILEGVHDLESLVLRLMEERGGSIAITPDIIQIVQNYGYSINGMLDVLNKLEREGKVVRHPNGWVLCL